MSDLIQKYVYVPNDANGYVPNTIRYSVPNRLSSIPSDKEDMEIQRHMTLVYDRVGYVDGMLVYKFGGAE